MPQRADNDYLIEFRQIGASVKVSAIDPVSHREVSIVGPRSATEAQLIAAAVAKLRYVLAKTK